MEKRFGKTEIIISAAGLTVLTAVFCVWLSNTGSGNLGKLAALLSAAGFAAVCLRFVPRWTEFWRGEKERDTELCAQSSVVPLFFALLLFELATVIAVYFLRCAISGVQSFADYLEFWKCTDSQHYLDIARDWYLSEGEHDRLVQLVFLPGYPVVVRLFALIVGNYLTAGLIVSALSFAGAGCLLYKLVCLDFGESTAKTSVCWLCLMPGAFFFAAPMSESLFLLLSLGCIYLIRRGRFLLGTSLGAFAAFTRSLGVVLIVPLLFELVHKRVRLRDYALLLIVPLGFAAYCLINYEVSGDAFKFMEYQREHWSQQTGWFFNTAAYQTENAISAETPLRWGLWIPNLIACFGSLAIVLPAARSLRPSYTAYFLAYYVVAVGATWLLSAPRYMTVMFTLPLALALMGKEHKRLGFWLGAAMALCSALYLCAFALRWQVW